MNTGYVWALVALLFVSSCQNEAALTVDRTAFPQSVASGDPHDTSVLLWTRYEGLEQDSVLLRWEIARDTLFSQLDREGDVLALKSKDFAVRVVADALQPGTTYYYRFIHNGASSPTGRTKTLPAEAERIVLGLANCAKFEGGYFHAYAELAAMDELDAVVHLGDYIYENPVTTTSGSYARAVSLTGRKHEPAHEIITLDDYRTRYRQYRSDPDLQRLHERHPMINIWDDHEFANNAWQDGASGHDDEDGDWADRKQNALQAYYEWMPIRGSEEDPIYRSFDFADVLSLHMIDTRLCCRNRRVDDAEEVLDTTATIIGPEQMDWLFGEIADPKAHWNVIGNQVKFSLSSPSGAPSLDKWGGYMAERNRVLEFMENHVDRNIVLITGDAHSGFDFAIPGAGGEIVADEFLLGSITSTNLDERFPDEPDEVARYIAEWEEMEDPHVKWFDLTDHGFMTLEATPDSLTASFYRLSTIVAPEYELHRPYFRTIASRRTD